MAQLLNHNMAAQVSLGELNKNITKVGKVLAKVSSGQKINSAADDSASFAISELMRVKIRALEQDNQNVQNGGALLRTAEAAIQNQIDIVKTIRAKVIDACNDSNSDEDRLIMQKEINQFYDQVDQLAYHTEYNTRKMLTGNIEYKIEDLKEWYYDWTEEGVYIGQRVDWEVVEGGQSTEIPGSTLDIIPNTWENLDSEEGLFDIFTRYSAGGATDVGVLGISSDTRVC